MTTMTGRKINVTTNGGGHYDSSADYALNSVTVTVAKETEKAIMVSRFVKSKAKEYTCWIPKSAVTYGKSGDTKYDETHAFMTRGFEKHIDSYKSWFFGC